MAALSDIFPTIKELCYLDPEEGVYLDGSKVALDNRSNNAYIRRTGDEDIEKLGNDAYRINQPSRIVAVAPNADSLKLRDAVINALSACNYDISAVSTDKIRIAEEELIPREELKKFDGVGMVMIDYTSQNTELYDVNCDFALC